MTEYNRGITTNDIAAGRNVAHGKIDSVDGGLLEIDFHFQVDSFGSNEEYVKY